jgi:hypothetical protein
VEVLKGARLRAVAVHGQVLAAEGLHDKVGDDAAVATRPMFVIEPRAMLSDCAFVSPCIAELGCLMPCTCMSRGRQLSDQLLTEGSKDPSTQTRSDTTSGRARDAHLLPHVNGIHPHSPALCHHH